MFSSDSRLLPLQKANPPPASHLAADRPPAGPVGRQRPRLRRCPVTDLVGDQGVALCSDQRTRLILPTMVAVGAHRAGPQPYAVVTEPLPVRNWIFVTSKRMHRQRARHPPASLPRGCVAFSAPKSRKYLSSLLKCSINNAHFVFLFLCFCFFVGGGGCRPPWQDHPYGDLPHTGPPPNGA